MKTKKYILESTKYFIRSYPFIKKYINEIEDLYQLNEIDLRERNEKSFLKLFQEAYDKSQFYHQLYVSSGIRKEDIQSISDLSKLPIVTKEMIRENANKILIKPQFLVKSACTSGSTGTPLKIYESLHTIWKEQAYTYCARKRNGFTFGQPLVSLRGNLDKRITHLKVHLNNTLYLSSYNINSSTIFLYYQLINEHAPKAIEGYPSSLYSLALFCKEAKIKLNIPITFTSSETLLDFQRELIESQLNTEIFDNYGMTEKAVYLQEDHRHNGYYELPGYSINEYHKDGLICTSLINDSFPLIRYQTGDIASLTEQPSGHPLNIVQRIEGRKDDVIICKDGTQIQQLSFILKGINNVKCTQMIQDENGFLNIRIVPDAGFEESDKNHIEQNVKNRIGGNNIDFIISIISEKDIIYTKRGKFKYLINKRDSYKRL